VAQSDAAARQKALEVALGEIDAFALVSSDVPDESWGRLQTLYQQIETDLGRQPTELRRPDLRAAAPTAAQPAAQVETERPIAVVPAKPAASAAPTPPKRLAPIWAYLGLLALSVATTIVVVASMRRQKSRKRSFTIISTDDGVVLPGRPASTR